MIQGLPAVVETVGEIQLMREAATTTVAVTDHNLYQVSRLYSQFSGVHGGWGRWSSWGWCNAYSHCHGWDGCHNHRGVRERTRRCNRPSPSCGGFDCNWGNREDETEYCYDTGWRSNGQNSSTNATHEHDPDDHDEISANQTFTNQTFIHHSLKSSSLPTSSSWFSE